MAIPEIPVTIGGVDYVARYPISAMLRAEQELGRHITSFTRDMSMLDMSILIKCGLHRDGKPVSSEEFNGILDNMSTVEFTDLANKIAPALFPQEKPGKN